MAGRTQVARAEHVGSLKRPENLQRTRERLIGPPELDRNLGAHNFPELRRLEDQAIREAVRLQHAAGLRVITDGEFRRRTWWTDFALGFEGVTEKRGVSPIAFHNAEGQVRTLPHVTVTGRIAHRRSVIADGFRFLRNEVGTKGTAKITIPAPIDLHYFVTGRAGIDSSAYPDLDDFWDDLIAAYRTEIAILKADGCTYLQLDDVALAFLCDGRRRAEVASWGDDPDTLLDLYIDVLNRCVASHSNEMTFGLHVCRGNMSGHWGAEGGYEQVADTLFNRTAVNAFFLEYDTRRAGGFEPLRFLPKGKLVVLGLISSKVPDLEKADEVKRRIDEAARYAPLDQLCLSPQCGFSSNYLGNQVTADDQKRKLELVVKIATDVWGSA